MAIRQRSGIKGVRKQSNEEERESHTNCCDPYSSTMILCTVTRNDTECLSPTLHSWTPLPTRNIHRYGCNIHRYGSLVMVRKKEMIGSLGAEVNDTLWRVTWKGEEGGGMEGVERRDHGNLGYASTCIRFCRCVHARAIKRTAPQHTTTTHTHTHSHHSSSLVPLGSPPRS